MRGLFFFIMMVALLITAVNQGINLLSTFEIYPFEVSDLSESLQKGIDPDKPQNISVKSESIKTLEIASYNEDETYNSIKLFTIVPRFIFQADTYTDSDFGSTTILFPKMKQFGSKNKHHQFNCTNNYIKNIRVYDHRTNSFHDVLSDEKKIITKYRIYFDRLDIETALKKSRILIETISEDSNGDGYLSCNDARSLFSYDFHKKKMTEVDLNGGQPIWNTQSGLHYIDQLEIAIGQDENGDGVHDPNHESAYPVIFDMPSGELIKLYQFQQQGDAQ